MSGWRVLCGDSGDGNHCGERDYKNRALREIFTRWAAPVPLALCSCPTSAAADCGSNRGSNRTDRSATKRKGANGSFSFSGGEGGIRTLDRGYLYTLSRRAPSTTRTPLLEVTHPATPKRPSPLLPLLPSGPGGVHSISPQGDQVGHHRAAYPSGIEVRMKLKGASFERSDNGPIDDR